MDKVIRTDLETAGNERDPRIHPTPFRGAEYINNRMGCDPPGPFDENVGKRENCQRQQQQMMAGCRNDIIVRDKCHRSDEKKRRNTLYDGGDDTLMLVLVE